MYEAGLNPPVIKKIMVAVDGSPASIKAIEHAVQMAREKNAVLLALYVDTTISDMDSRGFISQTLLHDVKEEKGLKEVKKIESGEIADILTRCYEKDVKPASVIHGEAGLEVAECLSKKYNLTFQKIIERGHEATVIVEVANQRSVDMIVIGSHGHKGFDKLLLGSVADKVSKLARCPVFIVKP